MFIASNEWRRFRRQLAWRSVGEAGRSAGAVVEGFGEGTPQAKGGEAHDVTSRGKAFPRTEKQVREVNGGNFQ